MSNRNSILPTMLLLSGIGSASFLLSQLHRLDLRFDLSDDAVYYC
ncbi:hypothetical protein [Hymenobacter aquaticus]|nr:hypothetical protein [Hymenobacter aquaticus]